MDIRFAAPDDIPEIAALWVEAFPAKRTVEQRIRMLETGGRYGGLETVLVARDDDGRLAGACKIYRMTQHLAGAAMPMMGLAAVAVAPYARRRGLGATLCGVALREARDRGDVLSTLYPFRPSYYERLGWGLAGHLLRYRFRTAHLPAYDEARHVRSARFPADYAGVTACYDRVAARSNGPIGRDRRIWGYRIAGVDLGAQPVDEDAVLAGVGDGGNRVVVCDDDGITGYAILRTIATRAPEDRQIQVRELVAENEAAYRALLGHVAVQKDQWPLGLHFARPDERFGDRLDDPRPPRYRESRSLYFPTATRIEGPMIRVVNAREVLARRPFGAEPATRFTVAVSDPQLPANEGTFSVATGAAGEPNEVRTSGTGSGPRVEADTPTLARLLAGEVAPTDAARLGRARLQGDGRLLDRLFAARPFWLLDEF